MFQTSCFNRLWKASRVHHSEADNKIPSSLLGPGIRPPDHNQSTTVRTGVIKPWMLGKSLNSWDDLRITRPGYDIHTLRHGPAMAQSKVRGFFPIDSMAHLSSSLHSYVNVYQRLLRCSYGFPMVFLWFSHGFPIETSIFQRDYCLLFQQAMPPRLPISVNEAMAPQKEGVSSVAWRSTGKWSPWRGHTMWGPPVMLVGL